MKLTSPEARAGANELARALLLFVVALVIACVLRLPDRAVRPMHVDETTQALKLKEMLEGRYRYDPVDHHGPTLLYSTVPLKWLGGAKTWSDLTESLLRLTPALYGLGLLFLVVLLRGGFSSLQMAWGALAVAVSPVMVFYSRYFIMETLLVFFTFASIGCGWRFYVTRHTGWVVASGLFAGLMHATKETCVLHYAAMGGALLLVGIAELFSAGAGLGVVNRNRKNPLKKNQILAFLLAAVFGSVLIFSQFFTDWRGVPDSIATYFQMIGRAGGQGHEKPFFYYLQLIWGKAMVAGDGFEFRYLPQLLGFTDSARIVWGERLLLILGIIGIISSFGTAPARLQSQHLARFFACYSILTFLIYSLISYKTPWCVMGAWHGMLIMAGVGARAVIGLFESRPGRVAMSAALLLGFAHTGLLAYRASRTHAGDSRNPLNYSLTSRDVLQWAEKLERFSEVDPKGKNLSIVQLDAKGGWPLPWYLARKFPNYYWEGGKIPDLAGADVILAGETERETLPEEIRQPGVTDPALQNWVRFPVTLHSSGWLTIYIRRALWENYLARSPWPPLPVQL